MKVLVIGSGVAGLTATLEALDAGHEVVLASKADLPMSNTRFAQGGVAVVLDEADSVAEHVADTMAAGAGISDPGTVGILCSEGPAAIRAMISRGVAFDAPSSEHGGGPRPMGEFALGLEAAHSHARILHAGGDATGARIVDALTAAVRASSAEIREKTTVVDLIIESGACVGARLLGGQELWADAVILATGGAGQLYTYTTNPQVATADGLAMALRAGAVAADLEFYQFHPTSLAAAGNFLISEAVRGEGAVLLDAEGNRFTDELAPRDVVARAIAARMTAQDGEPVRLDATQLGEEFLARRFPNIDAASRAQGFHWAREPLPVTPAAHYYMGGVRTDAWGRTSIRGLYAVGEAACTGLHGANRLASNSLLEGAVYGIRVVEALGVSAASSAFGPDWGALLEAPLGDRGGANEFTRADLQQLMWEAAGLTRTGEGLREAKALLANWRAPEATDAKSAEDANLLVVARAVVASALAREESRGGHHRSDFPGTDTTKAVHSSLRGA
jgi:L-aspartate oxidase